MTRLTKFMPICGSRTLKLSDLTSQSKDQGGPTFNEPWEAQAFAITLKLNEAGVFTWGEWAKALGAIIAANPNQHYYENWLTALEALVERKSLMTHDERLTRIEAWDAAAKAIPHGRPIEFLPQ